MAQKSIGTLLTAAALFVGSPAQAQDDNLTAMPPESAASGYRVDSSAGDFRLVTHGVWQAPVQIAGPAPIPIQPTGLSPSKPRKIQKAPGTQPSFRRAAYLPHVYSAEAQYGLPTGLLDALIWIESRYNPFAVSSAGAAGLGQLMPKTARELGVVNRYNPTANLMGTARYLRKMLDKFGVVHLAVAAYNAGPGAVERAGGIPLNGETPCYVRNVLEAWRLSKTNDRDRWRKDAKNSRHTEPGEPRTEHSHTRR